MTSGIDTPGGHEHTSSTPPSPAMFGMKRAAEVAGVSVSTIRRNKELLRQHGAVISPDGWQVPITALVASGLMRRQTPPESSTRRTSQTAEAPQVPDNNEAIRRLELEVLELRHRAELAEERQRSAEQRAHDARELADALSETLKIERRMLTAEPSSAGSATNLERDSQSSSQPLPSATHSPAESTAHRSWWRRMLG